MSLIATHIYISREKGIDLNSAIVIINYATVTSPNSIELSKVSVTGTNEKSLKKVPLQVHDVKYEGTTCL